MQTQFRLLLIDIAPQRGRGLWGCVSPFFAATAEPWESAVLALFLSLVPKLNFSAAGRRSGVAVLPFLHLTLLFALRQISSTVTFPRLPFHLLFDLMHHNERK